MKIKVVKGYTFVNANGVPLHLSLGLITDGMEHVRPVDQADKGFRWMFEGKEIPMPVRSGYWFNGMPEHIMLDWLKGNGWALRCIVNVTSGKAHIYELPFHDEPSKGNEKSTAELTDVAISRGEAALKAAILLLYNQRGVMSAVDLYRYVHRCGLADAKHAIDAIRFDNTP